MKKLTLLFICIANIVFSQVKPNNDLFKLQLKGNVNLVSELSLLKEYCDYPYNSTLEFDQKGNIVEIGIEGDKCRSQNTKYKIAYGSQNRIHFVAGSYMNIDQQDFVYNSKNQLISYVDSSNQYKFYLYTYKYDQNGNQIEIKIFEQIEPDYKKLLKTKDVLVKTESLSFDDQGNILKKEIFNNVNLKVRIETFKYDQNNNIIEIIDSNRLVNTEKNPKYQVDPTRTYEYVVDNQKNWISKTEYIDGKLSNTTTREIKYY